MKQEIFFQQIKASLLTLFLIAGCLLPGSGQGWGGGYLITQSLGDTVRNDIISIPDFVNGRTFAIGLYYGLNSEHFCRTNIYDRLGAVTTLHNPMGWGSSIDFILRSSVLAGPDSIIILSDKFNSLDGKFDLFATCYFLDSTVTSYIEYMPGFNQAWNKPLYEDQSHEVQGADIIRIPNGQFISLGAVQSEVTANGLAHELFIVKSDVTGQVIWTKTYSSVGDDIGVQLVLAPDGGYYLLKKVQADLSLPDVAVWLMKTDANGLLEWELSLGTNNDVAFDIISTFDGGLAITGVNANQDLFVLKTDDLGNEIWRQDYSTLDYERSGHGIIEDFQNNIIVTGTQTLLQSGEIDPFIAKLSEGGSPLWERNLGTPNREDGYNDIVLTPEGKYIMGGYRREGQFSDHYASKFSKTDTFGIVRGGRVYGNIFYDFNFDCLPSSGEISLGDWNVSVANDSLNFYGNTDAQGNYSIPVDVSFGELVDYTVSVIPPSNYWEACLNEIPVSINYLDSVSVDFAMQALVECPFMEGQVGLSRIRPCEPATIYISYCNNGTAIADSATIDVTLDPYLTYVSSTISPSEIDGDIYTFPIGDIDINECGDFSISVTVDCDSVELGDILCVEAHFYPDSLCTVPGEMWSGALMHLSYSCDNDSIQYSIENVGTAISQLLEYIIIEDAVLLIQDDFTLPETGVEAPEALPMNGSTYHLVAQQEPGAPGPEWISLGTMGCDLGSSIPLTEIPQYSGDPFTVISCMNTTGSYDPNDKQASPAGFGGLHNILPNTDLEYTIRFQNTGTDTAFRVVILDTLSTYLNPGTIVPGPSSHPYDFRLLDEGILSFTFHGIELPDSTTNLTGSQGFVSFKIDQDQSLPIGTVIENTAGIYFDFNLPILTNTTFHTVSQLISIVNSSVHVVEPQFGIKVIPNPMQNGAWIQLEGGTIKGSLTVTLYDLSGKEIKQVSGQENNIWLDRANLSSGMYFLTIENQKGWLASGKIIVQ